MFLGPIEMVQLCSQDSGPRVCELSCAELLQQGDTCQLERAKGGAGRRQLVAFVILAHFQRRDG